MAAAIAAFAFSGTARGDVVHLVDGSTIEGRVVREDARGVTVELASGTIRLDRAQIERIERRPWSPLSPAQLPVPAPAAGGPVAPPPTAPGAAETPPGPPAAPAPAPADVAALLAELARAQDFNERAAVGMKLLAVGPGIFGPILRSLEVGEHHPEARGILLRVLGQVDPKRAVPVLVAALEHEEAVVRQQAANALGAMKEAGRAGRPALEAVLARDADSSTRQRAVAALVAIADPLSVPAFVRAIGDANPLVRSAAREGVRAICPRPLPPEVAELLEGTGIVSPEARPYVAGIAAEFGESRLTGRIIEWLRAEADGDRRASYYLALGAFADETSRDALVAALSTEPGVLARRGAIAALERRREVRGLEPLIDQLRARDDALRRDAHRALRSITGETLEPSYGLWRRWFVDGGAERFGVAVSGTEIEHGGHR